MQPIQEHSHLSPLRCQFKPYSLLLTSSIVGKALQLEPKVLSFLSESLGAGDIDEITEEKENGNVSLAKEFKIKDIYFNGIAARNKQSKASSFFVWVEEGWVLRATAQLAISAMLTARLHTSEWGGSLSGQTDSTFLMNNLSLWKHWRSAGVIALFGENLTHMQKQVHWM